MSFTQTGHQKPKLSGELLQMNAISTLMTTGLQYRLVLQIWWQKKTKKTSDHQGYVSIICGHFSATESKCSRTWKPATTRDSQKHLFAKLATAGQERVHDHQSLLPEHHDYHGQIWSVQGYMEENRPSDSEIRTRNISIFLINKIFSMQFVEVWISKIIWTLLCNFWKSMFT